MSERIYIDTSAYYALVDSDDANHHAATSLAHLLSQEAAELYTSNFVIAETHTLILNRLGYDAAAHVLASVYTSATRITRATEVDERRGREIVLQHKDKTYSLVDAISFAIMERLHLRRAWSYDQHFRQFGFSLEH